MEVFDWDQVGTSDSLGSATFDLASLEPMDAREVAIPLTHPKHGQKGEVKLNFVFTPQIIARSRKSTSTFAVGGRAMTQVAALPFGAGKGLVGGVAHGVGGVASGVGKAGRFIPGVKRQRTIQESDSEVTGFSIPVPQLPPKDVAEGVPAASAGLTVPGETPLPELPSGQVSHPTAVGGDVPPSAFSAPNTAAMSGEGVAPLQNGTLKVTVLSAKDLAQTTDIKPYAEVKIGKKEFSTKHVAKTTSPEWNESFAFTVGPETETLTLAIFDHKSLGKDKHLGIANVEVRCPWSCQLPMI